VRNLSLVFAFLALLGTSLPSGDAAPTESPTKKAKPPDVAEIVGVWIGYWEDGEFTRLDLRADSMGYCAFVAPVESTVHQAGVSVYRVTRWSLDGWKFTTRLTPIDSRFGAVYLKGQVGVYALDLEVGGSDGKWKQKVVLSKETRIEASSLETKQKIEQAERK
jgi:hypothetical protein